MNIIRAVDRILGGFFTTPKLIQDEARFHSFRHQARDLLDNSVVESILIDMSNIDTKSTALLTHISVIIAALVFSIRTINSDLVRLFVGIV